ncbi:MAG: hypothetical protein RMZ69_05505 [Nostoc sp. ChiQUE01a]|nr:hypothetical protein [Nostoc sp. ChiQUE01a]
MKRFKSLDDLLNSLSEIEFGESLSFIDDDFNRWLLEVEEDSIPIDDSIREDDLTDEDLEFYPRSNLFIEEEYLSFTSSGESIEDSILSVLYEADLIDTSTLNKFNP